MSYKLDKLLIDERATLYDVWEASVRATHSFLTEDAIFFLKNAIAEHKLFEQENILVVRNKEEKILGFMGTTDDSLDMIFIRPEYIGKGIGKMLMRHAIDELNVRRVDVNEQNGHALEFYQHFGFSVVARSEMDEMGHPYPILHMQR